MKHSRPSSQCLWGLALGWLGNTLGSGCGLPPSLDLPSLRPETLDQLFAPFSASTEERQAEEPGDLQSPSDSPSLLTAAPLQIGVSPKEQPLWEHWEKYSKKNGQGHWASHNPITQKTNQTVLPVTQWERHTGYVYLTSQESIESLFQKGGLFSGARQPAALHQGLRMLAGEEDPPPWLEALLDEETKEGNAFQKATFLLSLNQHAALPWTLIIPDNSPFQLLRGTLFDYTRLNPWMHTVFPLITEFLSTTGSPLVAKGWTRSKGEIHTEDQEPSETTCLHYTPEGVLEYLDSYTFRTCPHTQYDPTFWVYVARIDRGLRVPPLTTHPWDATQPHPLIRFQQHEILVTEHLRASQIVAYARVTPEGKFADPFYIRRQLQETEPEAYEALQQVLRGHLPSTAPAPTTP